jgi:Family of unknown function (DUF6283)
MSKIRPTPCEACPYRCDVPSGLWAAHEYEKLREYDAPTAQQPFAAFHCHASPEVICSGWAQVHQNRGHENELLALRIHPSGPLPPRVVELFESGNAAADHGMAEIHDPSPESLAMIARLVAKHDRLEFR